MTTKFKFKDIYQIVNLNEFFERPIPKTYGIYLAGEDCIYWGQERRPTCMATFDYYHENMGKFFGEVFAEIWAQSDNMLTIMKNHKHLYDAHYDDIWKSTFAINSYVKAYGIYSDEIIAKNAIPENFIKDYYRFKSWLTLDILNTVKEPENYDTLFKIRYNVEEHKRNVIHIDQFKAKAYQNSENKLKRKAGRQAISPRIIFDPYKTATGRLTTKRASFPIHSLARKYRDLIIPSHDILLSLDYNAADLRSFLYVFDKENVKYYEIVEDVYDVFRREMDLRLMERKELKVKVLATLYDHDENYLHQRFNVTEQIEEFIVDEDDEFVYVKTPVKRIVKVPKKDGERQRHLILSYLIQSVTSDLFQIGVSNIIEELRGTRSKVLFSIHDEVIIDMKREHEDQIPKLKKILTDTMLGKFRCKSKIGGNFKDMK